MAHFAEIDENNIVIRVCVVDDSQQHRGQEFLAEELGLGGRWVQTSYNTMGGIHVTGGTPFRKNYAAPGYHFDEERDAFVLPQPYPSWSLNDDTCVWEPPSPYPMDGTYYNWNEELLKWVPLTQETKKTWR